MKTSKHNHKATNKLKVFLLSLFLLMPFICFIPTAFYYGFNEQAQAQERTITTDNYYQWSDNNQVYQLHDLEYNTIYGASMSFDEDTYSVEFDYLNITEIIGDYQIEMGFEFSNTYTIQYSNDDGLYISYGLSYIFINEFPTRDNYIYFNFAINDNTDLDFFRTSYEYEINGYSQDELIPNGTNSSTTYTMSITDSMSTAWTNTWSNPLFSWVNSNPLKSNIDGFVNWFGITDSAVIPQYLTYIISIVGIYIVIDIILVLFTHLTHMFSKEQS